MLVYPAPLKSRLAQAALLLRRWHPVTAWQEHSSTLPQSAVTQASSRHCCMENGLANAEAVPRELIGAITHAPRRTGGLACCGAILASKHDANPSWCPAHAGPNAVSWAGAAVQLLRPVHRHRCRTAGHGVPVRCELSSAICGPRHFGEHCSHMAVGAVLRRAPV